MVLTAPPTCSHNALEESGSDEDFMVDDDDDSDYGHSRKRSKKVVRRSRQEKKSPKPRLKATGAARGSFRGLWGLKEVQSLFCSGSLPLPTPAILSLRF